MAMEDCDAHRGPAASASIRPTRSAVNIDLRAIAVTRSSGLFPSFIIKITQLWSRNTWGVVFAGDWVLWLILAHTLPITEQ
jgi:hypothetical protein